MPIRWTVPSRRYRSMDEFVEPDSDFEDQYTFCWVLEALRYDKKAKQKHWPQQPFVHSIYDSKEEAVAMAKQLRDEFVAAQPEFLGPPKEYSEDGYYSALRLIDDVPMPLTITRLITFRFNHKGTDPDIRFDRLMERATQVG